MLPAGRIAVGSKDKKMVFYEWDEGRQVLQKWGAAVLTPVAPKEILAVADQSGERMLLVNGARGGMFWQRWSAVAAAAESSGSAGGGGFGKPPGGWFKLEPSPSDAAGDALWTRMVVVRIPAQRMLDTGAKAVQVGPCAAPSHASVR